MRWDSVPDLCESAAISKAVYTFDADPFLRDGWQDISINLGPDVASGMNADTVSPRILLKYRAVRRALECRTSLRRNFIIGARQLYSGNCVKSMCMIKPLSGGRFLCCISFMGSVQVDDWLANFDLMIENGLHRGFLRRALAFEEREKDIVFPHTAARIGHRTLTLRDIIERCAGPRSPFRLYITGHSLGAATMQAYIYRLLTERGLPADCMRGIGFASPSVAMPSAAGVRRSWPIRHVLNSADVVPHMGARVHLGQCVTYPADAALAMHCYSYSDDDVSVRTRRTVRPLYNALSDTGTCICAFLALMQIIIDTPPEEVLPVLGRLQKRWPGLQRIINVGDRQADRLNRRLQGRLRTAHLAMFGTYPADERIDAFREQLADIIGRIGLQSTLSTLGQMAAAAHSMSKVYPWIAQKLEQGMEVNG
ncbi:MAG: hypothetical protein IJK28_02035 [Clostridia bacterium]|nr:hypothetical protein [Clostridia bacterium]